MNSIQKEIVDLLRASGSKLVRVAGKGGEVWRLPNGMTFVTRTGKAQEHGVTHELADLRRKLGDVDVAKLAATKKAQVCAHNWQKRGAALFCTRCYDIKTNDEQPKQQEEQPKMEPLKIVPAAPAKKQEMKHSPWTDEQLKILAEGVEAEMTPAEIALLLQDVRPGVTNNQVSAQVSRWKATKGVLPPAKKLPKKSELYRTHWTRAQDRALIDAYAQKLSLTEVTKRLQSVRPGVSEKQVALHASELRSRMRSLNGEETHVGKGNGALVSQRGHVVPIEITKGAGAKEGAPVAIAPSWPPPGSVGLTPTSATKPQRALAKVTFEIEGKVRVVEVDAETARGMLRAAMEL